MRWVMVNHDSNPKQKKSTIDLRSAMFFSTFLGTHLVGSENDGTPPKSPFLIGFSIINHPFWGTTILGNHHFVLWGPMGCVFRLNPTLSCRFLAEVRSKPFLNVKNFAKRRPPTKTMAKRTRGPRVFKTGEPWNSNIWQQFSLIGFLGCLLFWFDHPSTVNLIKHFLWVLGRVSWVKPHCSFQAISASPKQQFSTWVGDFLRMV